MPVHSHLGQGRSVQGEWQFYRSTILVILFFKLPHYWLPNIKEQICPQFATVVNAHISISSEDSF